MKKIIISVALLIAANSVVAQSIEDCSMPNAEVPLMWLGTLADAVKKTNEKVPKQINQLSAEWKNEIKKGAKSSYSKVASNYYCTAVFVPDMHMYISFAEKKANEDIDVRARPGLKDRLKITAYASKGANAYRTDAITCFEVMSYTDKDELNKSYVKVDKKFGFPVVTDRCE